jgi:tubulin polyglutamylase TTLL1
MYKYFIGKGNNSIMVRGLFKNRFWWMQHDKEEMDKTNFCWTQVKNSKLMEVIPCKFPNIKSGLKNSILPSSQILNTP